MRGGALCGVEVVGGWVVELLLLLLLLNHPATPLLSRLGGPVHWWSSLYRCRRQTCCLQLSQLWVLEGPCLEWAGGWLSTGLWIEEVGGVGGWVGGFGKRDVP